MISTELPRYVAAGCLVLDKVDPEIRSLVDSESTDSTPVTQWHHLGPFPASLDDTVGRISHHNGPANIPFLAQETQHALLSPPGCLSRYAGLLREGWIHMSFSISHTNAEQGIVRVYVLPDDVDNRRIPRTDSSLRKARLALFGRLDFSQSCWNGDVSAVRSLSPSTFSDPETGNGLQNGEGPSLLQLFNSLPSPDPRPEEIEDFDARDAAYRLLDSKITGLNTTLYSYQRRSAAVMLQKEAQKQQVLDPRLVKVVDQLGTPWYYDEVTGTGLRGPRYYDGPCGGILAEEMGSGKTLICLALILASRHIPSATPEHLRTDEPVIRRQVGSLADMAAACITRNSVPWKTVFGCLEPNGLEYCRCVDAIRRNPGYYRVPPPTRRRETRHPAVLPPAEKVFLSHCSLVVVPSNLVQQWKQEIAKHTSGLKVFTVDKKKELPPVAELVEYDIVLFSSARFEGMWKNIGSDQSGAQILAKVHFKRCIVDEGHKLGNSTAQRRSDIHLFVDHLRITAKWIVTGTPSKGLFGVDDTPSPLADGGLSHSGRRQAESSPDLEREDLRRIGSIAAFYLKMRPWANLSTEPGDSPADWAVYVTQPKNSDQSTSRGGCLKATLESLIIRHRLSEIGDLLPSVDEKIVYLDGSFQDRLVLNLFSMMIIFNAVQSERTDQDYFFHPRQRKALTELVYNLRQASFFGGSFFSPAQIQKAVETAEGFLKEGKVQISAADEVLLRDAIKLGQLAGQNRIKQCANLFREVPLYVENFPWRAGREWSLDLAEGDPVCVDSHMVLALQKFLQPLVDAPTSLQIMFENGRFAERGREERLKGVDDQDSGTEPSTPGGQRKTLAGNTELGQDSSSPTKRRSVILGKVSSQMQEASMAAETGVAAPLAGTQLVSTASTKLSYLIDQIVKYQEDEQIIVFYENDNVAYYLAGVLEILQIHHLIYAKGLTPERRAQYVATFNSNPKFRVLLMDITQAAFGLDMKSASRIYFINPVLNPQIEAQAIGRARRISQKKPVTVETLVLRGSVEEVIVKRRGEMTQAEQWKCRSILDDKPIYEWILNARILPLPGLGQGAEREGGVPTGPGQMARLSTPQFVFGRGFGRELSHPDQDLVEMERSPVGKGRNGVANWGPTQQLSFGGRALFATERQTTAMERPAAITERPIAATERISHALGNMVERGRKRRSPESSVTPMADTPISDGGSPVPKRRARVRFADSDGEGGR